jgi:hypothetical protein
VHPYFGEVVYDGYGDGEFVLGGGVLASVRLDFALESEPVLALDSIGGVCEPIQFQRLADGTKRDLK